MANVRRQGPAGPVGPQGPGVGRFGTKGKSDPSYGYKVFPGTHNDAQGRGPVRTRAVNGAAPGTPLNQMWKPQPQPEPQIAPATNYDAMFRASIDAQRGQIDAQIRSALAALQQREANANALVARQPGEVNANYDQAQPALDAAQKTVEDAQGQLHVKSLDAPGAAKNPIVAAVAGDRAARLSDQPYLQAGTQEIYTRQRGALDAAKMQANGALDASLNDYLQQNALQDREDKRAADDRAAQEDTFYAHTQFQHDLDSEDARAAQQQARHEEKRQLAASEPAKGTPEWFKWDMQAHPAQARRIMGSEEYQRADRQLTHGLNGRSPNHGIQGALFGGSHKIHLDVKPKDIKGWLSHMKDQAKARRIRAALKYQGRI